MTKIEELKKMLEIDSPEKVEEYYITDVGYEDGLWVEFCINDIELTLRNVNFQLTRNVLVEECGGFWQLNEEEKERLLESVFVAAIGFSFDIMNELDWEQFSEKTKNELRVLIKNNKLARFAGDWLDSPE